MFTKEKLYEVFMEINEMPDNYHSVIICNDTDKGDREFFDECIRNIANDKVADRLNNNLIQGLPLIQVRESVGNDFIGTLLCAANHEHYKYIADSDVQTMFYLTDKKVVILGYDFLGGGNYHDDYNDYDYSVEIVTYLTEDYEVIMVEELSYFDSDDVETPPLIVIRRIHTEMDYEPSLCYIASEFGDDYSTIWDR